MEHCQWEEQQPILSQQAKQERKLKRFKKYLVDSQCVSYFVKFLLGIRKKQELDGSVPSQDPLQMIKEYIGAIPGDFSEQQAIQSSIETAKAQQLELKAQIQTINQEIEKKKEEAKVKEEEKRRREEEEAKNPKKGGKK